MEYCRHGCLRDYLVNKRHDFHDTMDEIENRAVWFKRPKLVSFQSDMLDFDDTDDHVVLTKKDLVSYAFQIARGMDFLASQKVLTSLTLSSPVVSNGYTTKCSKPYWSNPPFLFFLTFGHSGAQVG